MPALVAALPALGHVSGGPPRYRHSAPYHTAQRPEANQWHAVAADRAVAVGHHVDGNGGGVGLQLRPFLPRYGPADRFQGRDQP